jgi:putative hydrolase of HD superfamily
MNILHLALQVGISKKLPRTGWVREKVNDPESVAEHAFRVIVMCMALAPSLEVDQNKLVKMAIIHDLGETATGDIVVERRGKIDHEKRKSKEKIEKEAIRNILYGYGEDYSKLFQEMIERKTREVKIFWEIDVLERTIQAYEYERDQKKDLSEFFIDSEERIKTPLLLAVLEDIKKKRKLL